MLGVKPVLEIQEIDEEVFKADSSESNREWIAGKPTEAWLGANVGMSRCSSVCGTSDCRTLEVGGQTYETIPEEQFIKAGLMAANQLIGTASTIDIPTSSCNTKPGALPGCS